MLNRVHPEHSNIGDSSLEEVEDVVTDSPHRSNNNSYQPSPRNVKSPLPTAPINTVDGNEPEKDSMPYKPKPKPKKRRPMLTSSQLSDLFTRLDKNGDGVLDLEEFTGLIRLLKIDVSQDYVASVFRQIDQAAGNSELTGTLDMQEFIAAYQKIYCGTKNGELGDKTMKNESFVRATRYGRMLNGEYVFECYTIPSSGHAEKYTLDLSVPEEDSDSELDSVEEDHREKTKISLPKHIWDGVTEPWEGNIDNILSMIRQDSNRNKTLNSNVLWWIDAAYESVDRSTAEDIITRFGLPNDSKFLSSFGNFGSGMPGDPKSRVFAGIGNHTSGNVYSLSYFIQSMWIKGVPVVHHLPLWLRNFQLTTATVRSDSTVSRFLSGAADYYKSRFAWLFEVPWINNHEDEALSAYERAEGLASVIKYGYDLEEEEDNDHMLPQSRASRDDDGTLYTSQGHGIALDKHTGYTSIPTWLQSISHIHKYPTQLQMDSMSMHILDQGFGGHTLLTIRQIDSEGRKKYRTKEQQSRSGVLGRMVSGIWIKLAQTIIKGKGAGAAGDLTDSPASLATFLQLLMHNFSINSASTIDAWLTVLEKEIKDIVVSKHGVHLNEIERIIKEYNSYLDPLEGLITEILAEQESNLEYIREENALVAKIPLPPPSSRTPAVTARARKGSHAKGKRRTLAQFDTSLCAALPEGAEKLTLTYSLIHSFLGKDPFRELKTTLDGYELLEVKGLSYWKERMKKYSNKVDILKLLIKSQLDEKRNLTTFMLTAITTILAPLTIFTGYFGMNFENMTELTTDKYPYTPGVVLLWVICGCAYGTLLLLGIHFRILYSVT